MPHSKSRKTKLAASAHITNEEIHISSITIEELYIQSLKELVSCWPIKWLESDCYNNFKKMSGITGVQKDLKRKVLSVAYGIREILKLNGKIVVVKSRPAQILERAQFGKALTISDRINHGPTFWTN